MTIKKNKILIIDDEITVATILSQMIDHFDFGFDVLQALSFTDALSKYEKELENEIKLILLDYTISHENFIDSAKYINENYKDIVLIMITGFRENVLNEDLSNSKLKFGVLNKPILMDKLKTDIETIMEIDK